MCAGDKIEDHKFWVWGVLDRSDHAVSHPITIQNTREQIVLPPLKKIIFIWAEFQVFPPEPHLAEEK